MSPIYRVLLPAYEWGNSLMWALAILSVPFWLYVVVYAAPEAQTIVQQQQQDAIWRENRFFCEKHGMPAGTREHSQCTKDLMEIRAREKQRIASDIKGLL